MASRFRVDAASAWHTSWRAVVVNSFSVTGWRIGWLLVPDELVDSVYRLAGNFAICPPSLSQLAAVAAFDAYDELDANVARYAANRALVLKIPQIGIDRLARYECEELILVTISVELRVNGVAIDGVEEWWDEMEFALTDREEHYPMVRRVDAYGNVRFDRSELGSLIAELRRLRTEVDSTPKKLVGKLEALFLRAISTEGSDIVFVGD
jgi:hypothetical protein